MAKSGLGFFGGAADRASGSAVSSLSMVRGRAESPRLFYVFYKFPMQFSIKLAVAVLKPPVTYLPVCCHFSALPAELIIEAADSGMIALAKYWRCSP